MQHGQASLRALARRYGINPKTIFRWRARTSVADLAPGRKTPASTVLTPDDEAVIVAFRRRTFLPGFESKGGNRLAPGLLAAVSFTHGTLCDLRLRPLP